MPELIDKHAAYIRLKTEAQTHECYESKEAYNRAARIIDQMRTIEAEPARHGYWIFGNTNTSSWMKCSECLKSQSGQTATFSYCPNCGAKMDGGADNG